MLSHARVRAPWGCQRAKGKGSPNTKLKVGVCIMQRQYTWAARAVACCAWLTHCAAFGPDSNLSCLDEAAKPIDWWFTIKLPNG